MYVNMFVHTFTVCTFTYAVNACIVNISVKLINVYLCVNTSVNMMFHVCNKFTHSVQTYSKTTFLSSDPYAK